MKRFRLLTVAALFAATVAGVSAKNPADYVNLFIGTTNFGTTNPGATVPNGLMSVVPFNVMGSDKNIYDKDARWWSTPYEYYNKFFIINKFLYYVQIKFCNFIKFFIKSNKYFLNKSGKEIAGLFVRIFST